MITFKKDLKYIKIALVLVVLFFTNRAVESMLFLVAIGKVPIFI